MKTNVKGFIKENKVIVKRAVIVAGVTGVAVAGIVLYKKGFFALPIEELVKSTAETAELAVETAEAVV